MDEQIYSLNDVLNNPNSFSWKLALYSPVKDDWQFNTPLKILDVDEYGDALNEYKYIIDMQTVQSIVENAREQKKDVSLEDLLIAFKFYVEHDAFIDFNS